MALFERRLAIWASTSCSRWLNPPANTGALPTGAGLGPTPACCTNQELERVVERRGKRRCPARRVGDGQRRFRQGVAHPAGRAHYSRAVAACHVAMPARDHDLHHCASRLPPERSVMRCQGDGPRRFVHCRALPRSGRPPPHTFRSARMIQGDGRLRTLIAEEWDASRGPSVRHHGCTSKTNHSCPRVITAPL